MQENFSFCLMDVSDVHTDVADEDTSAMFETRYIFNTDFPPPTEWNEVQFTCRTYPSQKNISPRTLPLLCSKSFMTSPPILSSSSPLSPTGSAVPICGPSNGSPSSHETHECHSDCCISPSSERLPLSAIPLSSCQSTMPTPTLSQTTSLPTQNPGLVKRSRANSRPKQAMPKRRPPPPPPPLQVYVPDHEGTAQIEHDTQRDLHSMPSGNISHNTSMDNTDKGDKNFHNEVLSSSWENIDSTHH